MISIQSRMWEFVTVFLLKIIMINSSSQLLDNYSVFLDMLLFWFISLAVVSSGINAARDQTINTNRTILSRCLIFDLTLLVTSILLFFKLSSNKDILANLLKSEYGWELGLNGLIASRMPSKVHHQVLHVMLTFQSCCLVSSTLPYLYTEQWTSL